MAAHHGVRPEEHAVVVPQRRLVAGHLLDAHGGGDQGGAAARGQESGGPARRGAREGRVAGVLRRKGNASLCENVAIFLVAKLIFRKDGPPQYHDGKAMVPSVRVLRFLRMIVRRRKNAWSDCQPTEEVVATYYDGKVMPHSVRVFCFRGPKMDTSEGRVTE